MQGHGFLSSQRRGRSVYYRIVSPNLPGLIKCIRGNCPDGQSERKLVGGHNGRAGAAAGAPVGVPAGAPVGVRTGERKRK
jgi:hypothetical protein